MWFHKTIATVFGLGYAPKAPGTFGALGAVFLLGFCKMANIQLSLTLMLSVIIVLTLIGIYSTHQLRVIWGDDPSRVVIDEFVGMMVSVLLVPLTWTNILIGFILFRFFDIVKPLGVGTIDKKFKGAVGVILDDILAGIYSCIILVVLNHFVNF